MHDASHSAGQLRLHGQHLVDTTTDLLCFGSEPIAQSQDPPLLWIIGSPDEEIAHLGRGDACRASVPDPSSWADEAWRKRDALDDRPHEPPGQKVLLNQAREKQRGAHTLFHGFEHDQRVVGDEAFRPRRRQSESVEKQRPLMVGAVDERGAQQVMGLANFVPHGEIRRAYDPEALRRQPLRLETGPVAAPSPQGGIDAVARQIGKPFLNTDLQTVPERTGRQPGKLRREPLARKSGVDADDDRLPRRAVGEAGDRRIEARRRLVKMLRKSERFRSRHHAVSAAPEQQDPKLGLKFSDPHAYRALRHAKLAGGRTIAALAGRRLQRAQSREGRQTLHASLLKSLMRRRKPYRWVQRRPAGYGSDRMDLRLKRKPARPSAQDLRFPAWFLAAIAGLLCSSLAAPPALSSTGTAVPRPADESAAWVATWAASPQGAGPNGPPQFVNQTVRLVVHTSVAGRAARIRISNIYGDQPLEIGAAHLARYRGGGAIEPAGERALLFRGNPRAVVPAHGTLISDPTDIHVPSEADLAVSIYFPKRAAASTLHVLALQTSYVSPPGADWSASTRFDGGRKIHSWPFLSAVEIQAPAPAAAVVAFGDSTVDGDGSSLDSNRRWPNLLAHRLLRAGIPLSVVNEGLIANRLLRGASPAMRQQFGDIPGEAAVDRFARDVVRQAGARCVIIRLGTNDLGFAGSFTPASETVTARDLISGYERLRSLARRNRLIVIGTTIPPFKGTTLARGFHSDAKEAVRRQVNRWLRRSGQFDGLIDVDRILADSSDPAKLLPAYDSGDHLHPNDEGYRAIADAVPLSLLAARCERKSGSAQMVRSG